MTTTAPDPATETPRRGGIAAAIAVGAHAVVLLATFIAGKVVQPSGGGGMEDLAAVTMTFFGGEMLVGLGAIITSMVLFRRGWRYTGLGLMAGWIGGLALILLAYALA